MKNVNGLTVFCLALAVVTVNAETRHVGAGQTYDNLRPAANAAEPGDTILLHGGTYTGGQYITGLKGTPSDWITIAAVDGEAPVWDGGSYAWHMVDPAYVYIKGITIQNMTSNGVNVDDSGSYDTPAHNIIFDSCTFRDMDATGNNDLLKLSGVDTFEIRNCTILNGSDGGSGIDMVGCHMGLFTGNTFRNQGSNAIQAKGGTRHITIERNLFVDCGARTLNLGGSTGLQFFRPDTAHYEAADLHVYANVIIGSDAPIAYVGCVNVDVVNNTILYPGGYIIRILQETVDEARFLPCGDNSFRNNIVFRGDNWSDLNLNGDTTVIAPRTFTFSNNLWYNYEDLGDHAPKGLPVEDVDNVVGEYPGFADTAQGDYSIGSGSPASGMGVSLAQPVFDYSGERYASPPSVGAFEAEPAGVGHMPGVARESGVAAGRAMVTIRVGHANTAGIHGTESDLLGRQVESRFTSPCGARLTTEGHARTLPRR